jgi:hypothetical protein
MIYFATAIYLIISIYVCLWVVSACREDDKDFWEEFWTGITAAIMGATWPLSLPICYFWGLQILRR